jgi:hypothetical protein
VAEGNWLVILNGYIELKFVAVNLDEEERILEVLEGCFLAKKNLVF